MIENQKTKEHLKCELSESEVKQMGSDLAQKVSEIKNLENQKKAATAQFKSQIDKLAAEVSLIANMIQNGYEFRVVDCEIIRNFKDKIVQWKRMDTGEIFKDRSMTQDELQADLFEEDEEKKEKKEKGKTNQKPDKKKE